jgi:hypothetical protein
MLLLLLALSAVCPVLVGPPGPLIWVEKEIDPKIEKLLTNLVTV